MSYRVIVTPEARDQLDEVRSYLSSVADPETAERFANGILTHAAKLREFPRRGTPRDDLRRGARTRTWRGRVTIAYFVRDTEVVVFGIYYGGRDLAALMREG